MGMSASQANLMFLTGRLSDLELRAQFLQNDKVRLSEESELAGRTYMEALDAVNAAETDADKLAARNAANTAEVAYKIELGRIEGIDKRFDISLTEINTEHKAVETEMDAIKKVIDKNIEGSFKIFG